MKKLSKDQLKRKAETLAALQAAQGELSDAINAANTVIGMEAAKLEPLVAKYNEAVEKVEEFRAEIAQELTDHFDEKSEKWQEGDAGSSYSSWKGEWESLSAEQIEIAAPSEIEEPDWIDEVFDGLPDSPD